MFHFIDPPPPTSACPFTSPGSDMGIFWNCTFSSLCMATCTLLDRILMWLASSNIGRYWANISDTILTGSFRRWKEGTLKSQLYFPGDTVYHDWGDAAAVQWTAGTWMVEYGRGFLPSTLGFAICDSVFSLMDFVQVFKLIRMYTRALIHETLFQMFEVLKVYSPARPKWFVRKFLAWLELQWLFTQFSQTLKTWYFFWTFFRYHIMRALPSNKSKH